MITAILISMVVLGLAVAATGIAISSNNQSARDRTRLQTIDAAEAGLNETALRVEQSTPASLPCTLSGDLDANPPVHYQVTITYYATWPPSGSPMSCPPTATPAAATVASVARPRWAARPPQDGHPGAPDPPVRRLRHRHLLRHPAGSRSPTTRRSTTTPPHTAPSRSAAAHGSAAPAPRATPRWPTRPSRPCRSST